MDQRTPRTSLGNAAETSGSRGGREGGEGGEGGGITENGRDLTKSENLSVQSILGKELRRSIDVIGAMSQELNVATVVEQVVCASPTEEKGKSVEARSQYHSIQQLSLPSSKVNGFVPSLAIKTPTFHKLADFVTKSNGKDAEVKSLEDEDDDDEEGLQMGERFSSTVIPRGQPEVHFWKGLEDQKNAAEFSEEDEEFFRSSARDVTDCSDELSDVEMSFDGSVSPTGSTEDPGQLDRSGVDDDPTPEQDASSADVGGREVRREAKRARVESIIKTMTPIDRHSVQPFSNGHHFPSTCAKISGGNIAGKCDALFAETTEVRRPKRKQYIPQQVDPRITLGDGGGEVACPPAAKFCIREGNDSCNGLQKMEEELVEMQRKYRQLLKRNHELSFRMSDNGMEGQGRLSSERSSHISLSDVNQNDVKNTNKELRRNDVASAYDVINAEAVRLDGVTSSSLERLSKVLKVEIAKEVERLVDRYFTPFMARCLRSSGSEREEDEERAVQKEGLNHVRPNNDVTVNGNGSKRKKIDCKSADRIKEEKDRSESYDNESQIKEDLSSDIDSPEIDEPLFPVGDVTSFPVREKSRSTPSSSENQSSNRSVGGSAADIGSRLASLPHLHFLPVEGLSSDTVSRVFDRDNSAAAAISDYFDAQTTPEPFGGMARAPLGLPGSFGSLHPPAAALYYTPCLGKFPQSFLKDQDQMEPLPLIVGSAKKPKRSKVIDRVSPRATVRSVSREPSTQPDDGPLKLPPDSPGKTTFHHFSRYQHHPGAPPVHDSFPHQSLLQFGLAPPAMALHNPCLQQHSKFIRAMYSQMSSIGQRGDQTTSSSLPSPNHKSPLGSSSVDMVGGSKSIQKPIDYESMTCNDAMVTLSGHGFTSTLTPMHLRKAKLMFFYVRYPSSSILKIYFPDVKFNKNNTAQLVKWFSNFREFYYIQMEKYARQALAENVKSAKDLIVTSDSELYRILVVHYNRNCQIEVPDNFRFVVQATLREFFTSIAAEKDQEPSWKKSIYKVIQRLDDPVPEFFKSPNWMERLIDG